MPAKRISVPPERLPPFDRDFFGSDEVATRIGTGAIGGKASGLAFIKDVLADNFQGGGFRGISVNIPRFAVIAADNFDRFMERNDLEQTARSGMPDDRIAHAFQKAELPAEMVGDLRALIATVHSPLAIRSSSLLEDAMYEPFAGVYGTKMFPNNQPAVDLRFQRLVEAVKYVYASTFFRSARDYLGATCSPDAGEKMAVIIQEVVGQRRNDRFAPTVSGVARSHNYYAMGHARPGDGVVDLAVGLGKTIVDGGLVWTYSPAYPRANPPVGSPGELLKRTQTEFWAIHMGKAPEHDPIRETEYLVKGSLADAELDGILRFTASTYRPQDDRIVMGTGSPGPRIVTFEPILKSGSIPLNDLIRKLLDVCGKAFENEVEIEFAATLDPRGGLPARFGFLQVRPMVVSAARVDVSLEEMTGDGVLAASERVLGNGSIDTIADVVYVMPDSFEAKDTRAVALELAEFNERLAAEGRPYLLIGFGRFGSSDPWLGIPVAWGQISGARVIVEATLPGMDVELSQGSHFFHNLSSFQVCYFCVHHAGRHRIRWERLDTLHEAGRTARVRHVRLEKPLTVKVDGRCGRGVIVE